MTALVNCGILKKVVPITIVSSSYIVPENRGVALADPGPGSENTTLWELEAENFFYNCSGCLAL